MGDNIHKERSNIRAQTLARRCVLRELCGVIKPSHIAEIYLNILFVHRDFPGQFGALAEHLAQSTHHRVVFITSVEQAAHERITVRRFRAKRQPAPSTHHYLHGFEAG
ncbi:MAG: hypothetical protein J0626_06540, partial [Rhodospirillaceae bacterium]|nr:hypothetical protein [Rhodospirillaceae bacterium]